MADPWTPGPWKVTPRANKMIDVIHSRPFEKGAITLALCRVQARDMWVDEATANARLIAAAPELVALVEELASDLAEYVQAHYGDHPSQQARKARDMAPVVAARALLARIRNGGTEK